jgi:hypothetical protein
MQKCHYIAHFDTLPRSGAGTMWQQHCRARFHIAGACHNTLALVAGRLITSLLHRACGCASNINPLHWLLVSTCSQVPRPRLRTLNGVDADVNLQCRRASCVRASSSVAFIPAQELQRALAWQPCYMTGMPVLGQVRPTYGRHWSDDVTAS